MTYSALLSKLDESLARGDEYQWINAASGTAGRLLTVEAPAEARPFLSKIHAKLNVAIETYRNQEGIADPEGVRTRRLDEVRGLVDSLKHLHVASGYPAANPKSLPEWQAYVGTLSGNDLLSKAIAANQVAFVRSLEEDGLSARDIEGVFRAFATRLLQDEQVPPSRTTGDYIDYGMVAYPVDLSVVVDED